MTPPTNIEDRFKTIITSYLDINPGDITEQSSLVDDFEADEIAVEQISRDAEWEFDVDLPRDCTDLQTVGDWVNAIRRQVE